METNVEGVKKVSQLEYDEIVSEINLESRGLLGIMLSVAFGLLAAIVWAVITKVTGYRFYRQKTRRACPLDECRYF